MSRLHPWALSLVGWALSLSCALWTDLAPGTLLYTRGMVWATAVCLSIGGLVQLAVRGER